MEYAKEYLTKLADGLNRIDMDALQRIIEVLAEAGREGRRVFVCGNGGSAATASHFVNDLNKFASMGLDGYFKAVGLTDNVPLLTAWANDDSYGEVFSRQLVNFLQPQDVVVGISGSGNSPNVVKAMEVAKEGGAVTIGLLGFDGGKVKDMVDHYIHFQESHYGRSEDAHHIVCHIIANALREHQY